MADPFGDQDQSPGGAGKRPAQTIEGTATELSVEPEPTAEARAEPEPSESGSEGQALSRWRDGPKAEGRKLLPRRRRRACPSSGASSPTLPRDCSGAWSASSPLPLLGADSMSAKKAGPRPTSPSSKQRLAKLEAAPPASGNAEAVSQLESRIKALEDGSKETSPELAALAGRVAQLETSLKALAETAQEGGSVA